MRLREVISILCMLSAVTPARGQGGATRPSGPGRDSLAVYEVYAIRYAVVPEFPVAALVAGADTSRKTDVAMMVWLLEGPAGRRVLVDAGFYREKFVERWKPKQFVKPSEVIAKVGLAPEDITDVIITHIHWDHMDGVDLFPTARVWIQREEYEYYVDGSGGARNPGIDPENAAALAKLKEVGRLALVEGDAQEIIPGISCYTGGRHTYASQYVGVHTGAGTVVLASDNAYLYENLEAGVPIAQTLDAEANLAAQERMGRIASSARLIVPGHDPAVFARFPNLADGVARIH